MTTRRDRTAIIVGASLSGLMTALTLARIGVRVTLIERSDDTGRTGAAIHLQDGLLERITGLPPSDIPQPLAPGIQTWFAAHAGLRSAVDAETRITLQQNMTARRIGQDRTSAWVVLHDHSTLRADMVIGADGHRSVVRRHVAPDNPDAVFAGYVIWIGIADERELDVSRWPYDVAYVSRDNATLLGYPLPGEDGSTTPGHRRLGWAWYDSTRNGLLRHSGAVAKTVVRHSLMSTAIPTATYGQLTREAGRFPAPWRDAIRNSIERNSVIGTPIAEYVPDRLVRGRVALVGDAAHVPTPMTGSGFSESLYDAETLAEAVNSAGDISVALIDYENRRLSGVRRMVRSGQGFSRSFAGRAS